MAYNSALQMGALFLLLVLISVIVWPCSRISRFGSSSGHSRFAWFMVGPASAFVGGALGYFLFQLLLLTPSSPKELESFLVNQGVVAFLVACASPWAAYFGLNILFESKESKGPGSF
jgi:hypothetical protein